MRTWVLQAVVAGVVLCILCGLAWAASFDPGAAVGDRRVELFWAPDEDDPVFTGNLKIFPKGSMLVGEGEIPFLAFTTSGNDLWLWDTGPGCFIRWNEDSCKVVQYLDPPPGNPDVLSFALHPEGILLLAGLADGRIVAWSPAESSEGIVYNAHTDSCWGVAFRPLATEMDPSFVSVGGDGTWRYWLAPGDLEREVVADSTRPLTAVGIAREGRKIAVGTDQGRIRIFSIDGDPLPDKTSHGGRRVAGFSFSADEGRLASADVDGGVRIWSVITGDSLGAYEPVQPSSVFIDYTPRKSSYLSYAHSNGVIGLIDGYCGRAYVTTGDLGRPIAGFTLGPDGVTGYIGDTAGRLEWWYQGECIPSEETPNCFGGYLIFRGLYPEDSEETEKLTLLRVYDFSDSTWGWTPSDTGRVFVDPDSIIRAGGDSERPAAGPHNGTPYYYSIQKYWWAFLDGDVFKTPHNTKYEGFYRGDEELDPTPLIPRVAAVSDAPVLRDVYVVPNPYVENEDPSRFGPLSPPLVRFFNLPEEATICVYTTSGDLVRILNHFQTPGGQSGGSCLWDLKNDRGQDVTSGVYLFAAESPGGERTRGFFTIVR